MTFKTMMHLYGLLREELDKTVKAREAIDERVRKEKDKLESCWDTSDELEFWKESCKRHIDKENELLAMIEEMEQITIK